MDTFQAFSRGQANRDKPLMVFDWDKAAKLIKERDATEASAGLCSDWEWTGGTIYANGQPITDSYTYLASTWAVPELEIDGEVLDCYVMKDERPDFDSDTKWPQSALDILQGD